MCVRARMRALYVYGQADQGHLIRGSVTGAVLALCFGLLLYLHPNICVVICVSA